MYRTSIDLPEDLYRALAAAHIDVRSVCVKALEAAVERKVANGRPLPDDVLRVQQRLTEVNAVDDETRYRDGYAFGARWARTIATHKEREDVATWATQRWHQFALSPAFNSLPRLFCRELGLPEPDMSVAYWFERSAFTSGMVDGVAHIGAYT